MRLIISFAALLLSIVFVQLGSGALGPLDALSGVAAGFTTAEIGLLGSAHFIGFFIGCWAAPRMMGSIGHSRAFAAFAASGAIGALAHPLWYDPLFWAALRILTGIAVSGAYTVVEGWLNAKVTNQSRGRVVGVYRVVDLSASLVAQGMIAVLPPASYVSYNILAILCCLCLLPLTLTKAQPPAMGGALRLRPIKAMQLSPLAAAGVLVAGSSMPAFRMVGPLYGQRVGLDANGIALFLSAAVLGGALAQIPVGWIADKFDRRKVLTVLSAVSVLVCMGVAIDGGSSITAVFAGAFAFGLFAFPIYSISSAHANDFAEADFVAELNASLMFIYGMGAIASPLAASLLIDAFGPQSLFVFIAVLHAVLASFGILRMVTGPKSRIRTPYRYLPRTSFVLGRLMKRRRDG